MFNSDEIRMRRASGDVENSPPRVKSDSAPSVPSAIHVHVFLGYRTHDVEAPKLFPGVDIVANRRVPVGHQKYILINDRRDEPTRPHAPARTEAAYQGACFCVERNQPRVRIACREIEPRTGVAVPWPIH